MPAPACYPYDPVLRMIGTITGDRMRVGDSQAEIANYMVAAQVFSGMTPQDFSLLLGAIVDGRTTDVEQHRAIGDSIAAQFNVTNGPVCETIAVECETPLDDLKAIILGLRPGDQPFGEIFQRNAIWGIVLSPPKAPDPEPMPLPPADEAGTIPPAIHDRIMAGRTWNRQLQLGLADLSAGELKEWLEEKGVAYRTDGHAIVIDRPEAGIQSVIFDFADDPAGDNARPRRRMTVVTDPGFVRTDNPISVTAVFEQASTTVTLPPDHDGSEFPVEARIRLKEAIDKFIRGDLNADPSATP